MRDSIKLKKFWADDLLISILVQIGLIIFFFLLINRVVFPASFNIGPLVIHYYAIFILLAIIVAVYLVNVLWKRYFPELNKDISEVLLYLLVPGLIGARIYHVATEWLYYQNHLDQIFAFWQGGLGLIGALIGGLIGLYFVTKHYKISFKTAILTIALVLPLSQAIGRVANVFNYEIYGKPTDLPWALFVPADYRLPQFSGVTLYQPLFWYEAIANLILFWILFAIYRKFGLTKWILVVYLLGYGFIRFCLDFLRLEGNTGVDGLSYTQWLIIGLYIVVFGWISYDFKLPQKLEVKVRRASK